MFERVGKGLGLFFAKTEDDNERNCKEYWHPDLPGICTEAFERRRRVDYFDYPGRLNKSIGKRVRVKKGQVAAGLQEGEEVSEGVY